MKFKEYTELFSEIISKIVSIREKKSNDYASEDDTLLNFKKLALKREVDPSDIVRFFLDVKLQRLDNLKGKDPKCESVEDTIVDLINYAGLYYACLVDERSK